MFRDRKKLGAAVVLTCALLALVAVTLWTSPRADAAMCEDGSVGHYSHGWFLTPVAAVRTANGDCPNGGTCKEWCSFLCGVEEPSGLFQCFY